MLPTAGLRIDQAPPMSLPFRFFATAPLFLMLAGAGMVHWGDELFIAPLMPVSVATLHLLLIGWMVMIVCGAMIQMIPVLAGIPVPWPGTIPWVHGGLIVGTLAFALGLASEPMAPGMLVFAAVVLFMALGGFLVPIAAALVKAPAKHPTVNGMRLAMACLVGTALLGVFFLVEHAFGFIDLDRRILVGIHLAWGLLGGMGVLILGVSFQMLPMFYMTPAFPAQESHRVLIGLALSLLLLPVALVVAGVDAIWVWIAALPGLAGLIQYAITVRSMLRERKRKRVDPTLRLWLFGFGCAVAALALLAAWPATEEGGWRFLFATLFVLGWVTPVMIGMLHKIVPFLVWFHRFSSLAGLVEIPMMDDLTPERAVDVQVALVIGSVVALLVGIPTGWEPLLVLAGTGWIAVGGIQLYALWFALRIKPPEAPVMPDFASFFKDMPVAPTPENTMPGR
ncbi:hypothetical protein SIID45300_02521 [Candidatus Magnetaquicoccaceae bacterium FCR-1]|uniref:Uncharacterized protein n=1 Tax=Candidatus Magnetaquiglobus chichijimensis TaxID=3141448 RepID=A0ABQ0CBC3_9PROT